MVAAQKTVEKKFVIHSLHSYFLRAGDDDLPIFYYVDCVRDGATFCMRRVVAVQAGQPIFNCSVSFQIPENGLNYQGEMPAVPAPDALPSMGSLLVKLSKDSVLDDRARKLVKHSFTRPVPFEIKWTDPADGEWPAWSQNPPIREPTQKVWFRVRTPLGDQDGIHHAAIAYLSDWGLINVVARPHGLPSFNESAQVTSLDHTIWYHDDNIRADEWILYSIKSPRLTSSRALIHAEVC